MMTFFYQTKLFSTTSHPKRRRRNLLVKNIIFQKRHTVPKAPKRNSKTVFAKRENQKPEDNPVWKQKSSQDGDVNERRPFGTLDEV